MEELRGQSPNRVFFSFSLEFPILREVTGRESYEFSLPIRIFDDAKLILGQNTRKSEKYFSNVEPQIRRDFTFRTPMNSINASIAAQIPAVNAVSLHIRRGDYVSDAKAAATHGLCSIDYYQEAIRYISSKTPDPHFFIFSDDIEWAKENLHIDCHHQYINQNHGSESYNDMRLMSMCRHHIIANSSFSWWGAWLNPSSNKLIITPNNWFARNEKPTSDLIPSTWIAI